MPFSTALSHLRASKQAINPMPLHQTDTYITYLQTLADFCLHGVK